MQPRRVVLCNKNFPPQNDTFKYLDEQKLNFNPERQLFQTRYYTGVTNVLE